MMDAMRINKSELHWDILGKKKVAVLPKLKFLKDRGFYLAGGTALALQIGHRLSADLDFCNPGIFDSEKILDEFQKNSILLNRIYLSCGPLSRRESMI